jgi:hypothetical protein
MRHSTACVVPVVPVLCLAHQGIGLSGERAAMRLACHLKPVRSVVSWQAPGAPLPG